MPPANGPRRAVLRALSNVGLVGAPSATSPELRIEALDGGVGGRSYAVACGSGAWVVRVPADHRAGALDVDTEAEITRAAAALGIAPRVIATDPETGALVTERIRTAHSTDSRLLKSPQNIMRAAWMLRRLHTIRHELRIFDPEAFAAEYLAVCDAARVRGAGAGASASASGPDAAQRLLAAELRELAQGYRARHPSIVVCHNDLVAANILDDGELKLVDFEYAVLAAPVLDIAGLAALNDFDKDERWRLAVAYYGREAVPFTADELDDVIRLVRLIAYFWALSTAATSEDRAPYDAFAARTAASLADNGWS